MKQLKKKPHDMVLYTQKSPIKTNSRLKNALVELERRRCSRDSYYFATQYCLTLDSDHIQGSIKPFPDYPYLRDLFNTLSNRTDIHIEKSRQMLISWSIMIHFLHTLLFRKDNQLLVLSAKAELADDGGTFSTPQSLLGKVRFVYDHLPEFLKKNSNGSRMLSFKHMYILNEYNNAIIKAEAAIPNAGRGGNYRQALVDEAAYIPNSESLFTSVRLACKEGLILCSTPNGKGNIHWRVKYGCRDSGFKYLRYHWSEHPGRDMNWYRERCKSLADLEIARELDISYEGSLSGRIYTEFEFKKHVNTTSLIFNPDLPLHTAWDFGIGDPTSILFLQVDPFQNILVIDEFEDCGRDSAYYAERVKEILTGWGIDKDEACDLLRRYDHYGDPAGTARGPRLESWISDIYHRTGMIIKTRRGISKIQKINRVKILLRENRVLISPSCIKFIEALQNYRMETDQMGRVLSEKPVHDWTSHSNDAFQEFCINKFPLNSQRIEGFRFDI